MLERKKNEKKKLAVGTVIFLGFIMVVIVMIGNPAVFYHNCRWNHAVRNISEHEEKITLNEMVPFEWDSVYTFLPYTSREEIWRILGIREEAVTETVNEGMVQLIFLNEGKVTASICGYESRLGYSVKIPIKKKGYTKIDYEDNFEFYVSTKKGNIRCLTAVC